MERFWGGGAAMAHLTAARGPAAGTVAAPGRLSPASARRTVQAEHGRGLRTAGLRAACLRLLSLRGEKAHAHDEEGILDQVFVRECRERSGADLEGSEHDTQAGYASETGRRRRRGNACRPYLETREKLSGG